MQSMRPTHASRLALGFVAALTVSIAAFTPPALAETGLPQGSTGDVVVLPPPLPAQPAIAPSAPAAPPQAVDPNGPDGADGDGYADTDPSALTDFREPLAPYGQWTEDPTYGTIWVPDSSQVGADFAPYQTGGSWGVADSGDWMWQSDYNWGFIPFHYGRWVYASNHWGWIAGRQYAPAWVAWRVGEGGYVGWAPLPPSWYWGRGAAHALATRPYAAYCFAPTTLAFQPNVSAYVVRDRAMVQSIAATTRPYHPATPTVGSRGGSPNGRMSPTLSEAHIPASASPRGRAAAPDARSMAYATRSSTASLAAGQRGYARQTSQASPTYYRSSSGSHAYVTTARPSYEHASRAQSPGLRTPGYGSAPSGGFHASYPSYHAYTPSPHHATSGTVHAPAPSSSSWSSSAGHSSSGGHSGGGRHR